MPISKTSTACTLYTNTQKEQNVDGFCIGTAILTYEWQGNNKLWEKNLTFDNPCHDICKWWVEEMQLGHSVTLLSDPGM